MEAPTASRPRRRLFGPLFYTTLALGILATLFSVVEIVRPRVEHWLEVRSLGRQLLSPDSRLREAAAYALQQKGAAISVPLLLRAMDAPRAEVRATACRNLALAGADARTVVSSLVSAAGEPDESVRIVVAQALEHLPGSILKPPSLPVDESTELERAEARAHCVAVLRRLLADRSAAVRATAVAALGAYGPDPGISGALRLTMEGDADPTARLQAARVLLKLNGPDDPDALRTMLAWLVDPDGEVDRTTVIGELLNAGPMARTKAVSTLAEMLPKAVPLHRAELIELIAMAGPAARGAVPIIEASLDGDDPYLRASAYAALVEIEGPATAGGIARQVRMVADPLLPDHVRHEALSRLLTIAPSAPADATPDLILQLGDPTKSVREAAATLLQLIVLEHPARMLDPSRRP